VKVTKGMLQQKNSSACQPTIKKQTKLRYGYLLSFISEEATFKVSPVRVLITSHSSNILKLACIAEKPFKFQ
jgi:hypothetical protein